MISTPLLSSGPFRRASRHRPAVAAGGDRRPERPFDAIVDWLETPLPHEVRSQWVCWGGSVGITAAALALRQLVDPWVHDQLPLSTLYGAVAVVVWFAGLWPAVVTAILGFLVADYLFIGPRYEFTFHLEDLNDAVLFGAGAGLTIVIGVRMRSAQARARENGRVALERQRTAERALADLRNTQKKLHEAQRQIQAYADGLEKTVAERTMRLQETVHELEAFSYSIAHDMRAPLRSMIGYAEIVCEEHAKGLDERGRDYLSRIAISARRLDGLIQDVLNYSRIVREALPLERVDARALVLEVIDSYPNLAAAKPHVFVAELPAVIGNRAALTQVLSNLLGNAVKFVPAGVAPAVRVYAEPAEPPRADARRDWVRITVADNGIGIDETVIPRLFAMFQRFTRPGLYEGTGMGLAIARKAVDRMGGLIGVESTVGKGSRFWFVLPRAVRTDEAGRAP